MTTIHCIERDETWVPEYLIKENPNGAQTYIPLLITNKEEPTTHPQQDKFKTNKDD